MAIDKAQQIAVFGAGIAVAAFVSALTAGGLSERMFGKSCGPGVAWPPAMASRLAKWAPMTAAGCLPTVAADAPTAFAAFAALDAVSGRFDLAVPFSFLTPHPRSSK